jgi:type I restriction enzyme S subunit
LARLYSGGTPDRENRDYWEGGTVPWLNSGEVNQWLITKPSEFITELGLRNSSAKWIPKGALVMALAGQGKTKGTVAELAIDSTCNQSMAAIVPGAEGVSRFLLYWLSANYESIRNRAGGEQRDGLNLEIVGDIPCPQPNRRVQRAIADYLDHETARLDALVAAKERVLGLLAEKRRALITRAVTRGLDLRASLRDSGIPWLGKIPAHWEIKRLKHVGRAIIGLTFDPADTVTEGSGVLVLRASNVQDQKIVLGDNLFVLMDIPEALRTREGDILICSRSGSRALIGKNALIDQASAGLTFGAFMTVFRSPNNEYLFYIFNSPLFDYQAGAFSTSTINQLTVETLNGMEIPLPPPSEQKAIAATLRERTSRLDRLAQTTGRTIALLKERRAALIEAAVTGQIDVESAA